MLKIRLLTVVAIVFVASSYASAQGQKLNITGKWVFEVQTDAGTGTPTVTIKQEGEKVSGHYSSQTLGEADFTGTLKGQALTFNFQADLQGTAVPVTYVATVDINSSMKCTIDI